MSMVEGGREEHANAALPFYRSARKYPGGSALRVDGESYSYGNLAELAAGIAGWLRSRDCAPAGRVGILCSRSVHAYAGILGVCWSGSCYVPFSEGWPDTRVQEVAQIAQLDALLVEKNCLGRLSASLLDKVSGKVLLLDDTSTEVFGVKVEGWKTLNLSRPVEAPIPVGEDQEAYLVFTSGTTGSPNGVAISVGNLAHGITSLTSRYSFSCEDRFSQFFDLSFDFSVMDLFVPWGVGAETCVLPAAARLDPRGFIRDGCLTVWTCIPSSIAIMRRMGVLQADLFPSLRLSCFSGEALAAEAASSWQKAAPNSRIVNLYGQTEAPIGTLAHEYGPAAKITEENGFVAIGTRLPFCEAGVLSAKGRFLEPGNAGELAVAGSHVAGSYVNNASLTEKKFVLLDHPEKGRSRWYRTGDLARENSDGTFHFLGRMDNEVKVSGHRVMLEEVEFYLRQVVGERECAVIPHPSRSGGVESLVAFVAGGKKDEEAVKREMGTYLARPLVPRRIFLLGSLPLSRNGKVDRGALERIAAGGSKSTRSDLEEKR
jgi:amino acid adenylation domain-containing protein